MYNRKIEDNIDVFEMSLSERGFEGQTLMVWFGWWGWRGFEWLRRGFEGQTLIGVWFGWWGWRVASRVRP